MGEIGSGCGGREIMVKSGSFEGEYSTANGLYISQNLLRLILNILQRILENTLIITITIDDINIIYY